jgi:hypothetical protein
MIQALPIPPSTSRNSVKKVHTMTSAMPAAPSWFPRRAVCGDARNLRARMKLMLATSQTRKVRTSSPVSSGI